MKGRAGHPGQAGQAGQAGLGVDATLAAVATMAAAWPISTLLAEPTWLPGTVLLLGVIALTGVGARWLALRGWQVLTVQTVCSVLAAGAIYGREHLWYGLPTFEALGFADLLVNQAITTAQAHAAPAPTSAGLIFVVGCSLGLVALAVDYLAVTRRSPSLAGLPLLTAFLASAANSGSSLPVNFFLAAATIWLILVARVGSTNLRRWGTTVTVARTPSPQRLDPRGVHKNASRARLLGVVALAAAVAVPVILPQPEPKFLASGLGRSPAVNGSSPGGVGFSLSLALAADLKNRSKAPVLQFTTADTSPPPLRVTVSSFYRSEHGVWLPWGRPMPALSTNPDLPQPTGLSPEVPRRVFGMKIHQNRLDDPYLAVPFPLIDADIPGVEWGEDAGTQGVRVAERPDSYTASYLRLEPTGTMLRSTASLSERDRDLFDLDLALHGPYVGRVTDLAEQLTSGKTSAYDKAMEIQQYLRATGGFTYSLTLAPPVKDGSGRDAGFDPLTNFLVTKRGYCVQFATAMAMMSRAAGIPARIAIGFLPGTEARGVWSVTASDAHAWPELYLKDLGWTRFEPTPSRGAPPVYAIAATSPGTAVDGGPLDEATAPAPSATAPADRPDTSTGSGTSQEAGLSPASVLRWVTRGWGPILLGSLIVLLGSLIVPTAAFRRRRRNLAAARSEAQRIEVQWELLTSHLSDLGIAPAPSRTPRQQRAYYDREAFLEGAASQALGRVVQTLERSRYAVLPPAPATLSKDARQVYRAAAGAQRGRNRLRAALWPSDGIAQLRSARAELAWRVRAPLRDLSRLVRQRFQRRHH
jgi:hypothetical protein